LGTSELVGDVLNHLAPRDLRPEDERKARLEKRRKRVADDPAAAGPEMQLKCRVSRTRALYFFRRDHRNNDAEVLRETDRDTHSVSGRSVFEDTERRRWRAARVPDILERRSAKSGGELRRDDVRRALDDEASGYRVEERLRRAQAATGP
jgi:hypothetical protein